MKDPSNRWFARQNVRRLEAEPIQNTMAYLRAGKRFVGPDLRDQNLMLTERYFQNFDGPSPIDLVDRRVSSISASQALFLMNDVDATRAIADGLAARLGADSATGLPEMLDTIYKVGVQRKPSKAERHFAAGFVERRRHQTGASDPAGEVREFLHLLLCANEMIYIE